MISEAEKNVKSAIARQLAAEDLTKIAEMRTADINSKNNLADKNLAVIQAALNAKNSEINAADKQIERQKIIRDALKNL
jgi:hypothetical protein